MWVETRAGEERKAGRWGLSKCCHLLITWQVLELVVWGPSPDPRVPLVWPLPTPLPRMAEPCCFLRTLTRRDPQRAGRAGAGCRLVQVRTLLLGSWVAA